MLGHHDDTVYGIGWEGEEGRSDVKACGDYPAVISFDLGELELGNAANLDKVPFDKIRKRDNQSVSAGRHGFAQLACAIPRRAVMPGMYRIRRW